ncbi:MAG: M48 family metallopeptidase [Allosphingosinicella sp.]|uniref:M48 family metallopeptidase n=1 Tax=Allosphingosinicella sp. TaxID=2823234 RepID=UPI003958B508
MSSDLQLGGAPLTLKPNRRARRLRLRVDARTRSLTLTVPPGVSRRRALEWAAGHADWAAQSIGAIAESVAIVPGATLPLFGELHRIDAVGGARRVTRIEDRVAVGGPAEGLEARVLRWLKAEALTLLSRETQEFAAKAGVSVASVAVGDPRSRWGSCASDGRIRYSWRLIMAPDFVRRATVAHEVAHRVHMDHSPRFHATVRELLGDDPAPARAWLRREGGALHRIGAGR